MQVDAAAVVKNRVSDDKVAANDRTAEVRDGNTAPVPSCGKTIVGNRVVDDLRIAWGSVGSQDSDSPATDAAVPCSVLIVVGDGVVGDQRRTAVHINSDGSSSVISGDDIGSDCWRS